MTKDICSLLWIRSTKTETSTSCDMWINGKWFCYGLERNGMIIPAGHYQVILNMSNRFKRVMPLLLNVQGREGIRIHGGNTFTDSLGCPLVAHNRIDANTIQGSAEEDLMTILRAEKVPIWMTIVNM